MKNRFLLLCALFVLLLFPISNINAQTKTATNDSTLLYEITGKGLKKPSYLFGTIHLICQKDMFPMEKFNGYLGQTKQLLLEIDISDQAVVQKAVKASMLGEGKTVKDYVKPEEYAKINELFKNSLGISFDILQGFKPIVSQTYLLTSPKVLGCQPTVVYDNFLAQTASASKMPIIGLETVEQQFAAIDSTPIEKQIESLNKAAANPEKGFAEFKTLYQTYLTQNSNAIYDLIDSQMAAEGFDITKLLDERNSNWIPIIEKKIRLTPSFIAVGSGHLGGKKGVVNLLRAKGYKLKPIKF